MRLPACSQTYEVREGAEVDVPAWVSAGTTAHTVRLTDAQRGHLRAGPVRQTRAFLSTEYVKESSECVRVCQWVRKKIAQNNTQCSVAPKHMSLHQWKRETRGVFTLVGVLCLPLPLLGLHHVLHHHPPLVLDETLSRRPRPALHGHVPPIVHQTRRSWLWSWHNVHFIHVLLHSCRLFYLFVYFFMAHSFIYILIYLLVYKLISSFTFIAQDYRKNSIIMYACYIVTWYTNAPVTWFPFPGFLKVTEEWRDNMGLKDRKWAQHPTIRIGVCSY